MRNRPNAVELIGIAEKLLSDEVAPDLTARQRYHVALISSAMGIARRELEGGVSAFRGEIEELQRLYTALPSEPPEAALDRLNRLFAADLRAGRFDRGANERDRKTALALLKNDVLARLAEDNPRYVK
jgi:hypothetical protein